MHFVSVIVVFSLQQAPTRGDDNQSSAHLHRRQRDSEKRENVCPNQVRTKQKEETVDGNLSRERPPLRGLVVARQGKKNGASAEWIDNREKSADNEENVSDGFHLGLSLVSFAC